ncbi:hypothetical protein J6590_035009 [Homalodisca vitripennis]|nr:hypothetical protein J6590_035009 [Homalodisca vitripennis]
MEMKVLLKNELKSKLDVEHNSLHLGYIVGSKTYATNLRKISDNESNSDKDDLQSTSIDEDNTETATHRNIWQCYKKCATRKIEDVQDDKSRPAHELQSYCALLVIKCNDDPFHWAEPQYF